MVLGSEPEQVQEQALVRLALAVVMALGPVQQV